MSGARRWLAALLLAVAGVAALPAAAQYAPYPDEVYPEDRPPPRRARPGPRGPVGLNCDAVQEGLTGPKPFSCPLPGPRPLGTRCFCDLPLAPFSPPRTAVGQVVR